MKKVQFTAVLEREGNGYVARCPELDVASQGDNVNDALNNLREAVALFLDCAPLEELERRYRPEIFGTQSEADTATS